MPLFPDSVVKAAKTAKEIAGLPNAGQRYLMELLDPQNRNLFEILLYPQNLSLDPSVIAHAILDTAIARLHIQNLSIPFFGFEYENAGEEKYIKDVNMPDEITITFIENEEAFVRNYLQAWLNQVIVTSTLFGEVEPFTNDALKGIKYNYIFDSDQYKSKKNAKVILQTGAGLPSPAILQIEGLKPKQMNAFEIGHDQSEPLRIEMVFSVEMIYVKTPL